MTAIRGGKIHTITNGILEKGTVIMENGKITGVGRELPIPLGAEIIDAEGKYIFPGFIDAHTHAGLFEEGMGFEGEDGNELTEPVTPHLRAIDGINPEDEAFKDALAAGITTVVSGPGSGNVVGGQALAMKTAGRTMEEMVIKEPIGMKIALGENPKRVYNEQKKMPSTRMGTAALLRDCLVQAQNYLEKLKKHREKPDEVFERELKWEAMIKVLEGEIPLRAHAHRADDILTAIRIAEEFGVKVVIEHATEGHKIAQILAEKGVPVVVGPGLTSRSKIELKEMSFRTPGILAKAGVKVALMTDHPVIPVQYLPICAVLAVKEGMAEEDALRAITINAAEIIGLDHRLGSIEVGKDGDLVIYNGHPFNYLSRVEKVFVNGRLVYTKE
ncbi:MAG TPA: amidohydrolase [Clostridia bacterium]|nr:amidohydrolase [Clostridia bacterium]